MGELIRPGRILISLFFLLTGELICNLIKIDNKGILFGNPDQGGSRQRERPHFHLARWGFAFLGPHSSRRVFGNDY
jgi:hypothetical protein